MNIEIFWHGAGLVTFWGDAWALHVFPSKKFRTWGHRKSWYDGMINEFGIGPFFLFIKEEKNSLRKEAL